jgi:hypothetical protein
MELVKHCNSKKFHLYLPVLSYYPNLDDENGGTLENKIFRKYLSLFQTILVNFGSAL